MYHISISGQLSLLASTEHEMSSNSSVGIQNGWLGWCWLC